MLWKEFYRPTDLPTALQLKADFGSAARFIAGGTDIIVDLERGRQPHCALIDISGLAELRTIQAEAGGLRLGGAVTHADLLANAEVKAQAAILVQAAIEVGAPQIRNRSSLAGNLVTASPAADTVPPLLALNATVELASVRGSRQLLVRDFITGFRKVALADDEIVRSIFIPSAEATRRGVFLKLGLRKAQAISVISVSVVAEFDRTGRVTKSNIALGSVAATPLLVPNIEAMMVGQRLDDSLIEQVAAAAMAAATPISDVRGGASYRKQMVKVYTTRALRYLRDDKIPPPSADPTIFLQTPAATVRNPTATTGDLSGQAVELTVNGQPITILKAGDTVLLYALRQAGFVGSKEGCFEGECGACTVLLDGRAVNSCLVPAQTAHGGQVKTVEGLANGDRLHPLQQSFVNEGGVQCGYCTPGLLMAGATLLEERPDGADEWQCRSALVGNLCRCTGYGKVLTAMAQAQTIN